MKILAFLRSVFLFPLNIIMGAGLAAQLAQKTKLYIETGSGGAITITGITKAFKGEVTGTNTLSKGDRVTLASIGGMTECNGLTVTVLSATSSAFVADLDTRLFTTYTSGGTATPVAWTQILGVMGIDPGTSTVTEIPTTDLESDGQESQPGIPDHGSLTGDIKISEADPGQAACLAAFQAGSLKSFKMVSPSKTRTWSGCFVSEWPTSPNSQVNSVQTGRFRIKLNSEPTVA